jgi:hypothetical protein
MALIFSREDACHDRVTNDLFVFRGKVPARTGLVWPFTDRIQKNKRRIAQWTLGSWGLDAPTATK